MSEHIRKCFVFEREKFISIKPSTRICFSMREISQNIIHIRQTLKKNSHPSVLRIFFAWVKRIKFKCEYDMHKHTCHNDDGVCAVSVVVEIIITSFRCWNIKCLSYCCSFFTHPHNSWATLMEFDYYEYVGKLLSNFPSLFGVQIFINLDFLGTERSKKI